jgi:hypothetical protein
MAQNAEAPRNGGRIESDYRLQAAPPLSWGACLAAFIVSRFALRHDV